MNESVLNEVKRIVEESEIVRCEGRGKVRGWQALARSSAGPDGTCHIRTGCYLSY